jgi:hypothetical protein
MSVQLILYPQTYDGQFNQISTDPNEFVVNGLSFIALSSASSYDSSANNVPLDVLTNAAPSVVNTWYRFRSITGGTPALPTDTSNNLVLNSIAALSLSGVYQRLSNLIIGQIYTITVNVSTTASGNLYVGVFNGTSLIINQPFSAGLSTITQDFTATASDNTLMISYLNGLATNLTISSISIQPQGTSPNLTNFELEDGQVICDLYENEDLPLTLSIDDFKNVAEKVQSYSKAFKLPATKRNNQIFDNIFEITRADDGIVFNPYVKTQCVLKQDGFVLFEGYLRLIDIQDKASEISYNVNLYSEVVSLADVLKEKTFSDLDFTELEHDYNKTEIKASWTSGLTYLNSSTSGYRTATTVKYPFVNWGNQIPISDGTTGISGYPQLISLENAFRPFINIKYCIERIFQGTPFSFTSDFFDEADFKKLYMDFNWGADNSPVEIASTLYPLFWTYNDAASYATTSYTPLKLTTTGAAAAGLPNAVAPPNYNTATNILTATANNETYFIQYAYILENTDTVDRTIECQWLHNSTPINYSGLITLGAGSSYTYVGNLTITMQPSETLQAQFKSDAGGVVQQEGGVPGSWNFGSQVYFNISFQSITTGIILQTLRGELGQWDFLKGIMTMFNLVSIPDKANPNNILIEPYADVFIKNTNSGNTSDLSLASRSIAHDWTDKIDISEMKLTPLTDLNKTTIFKFAEDEDDWAFMNYKNQVGGHLYGSKVFDASGFTVLEGVDEIIAEPFAATIPKPLMAQFPGLIVPVIYSYNPDDDTSEAFDNSPRIMYDNGVKDSGITYYIPDQNGLNSENQADYLQFSHLSTIPTAQGTIDFHFGQCQLVPPIGNSVPDNLFNLYWMPYFAELYNPDTRMMTLKVNLNAGDIATFNMYDTVFIKNREFRVNKIDYKPNDLATVEFILIP